jgi:hypothetical protein
MGTLFESVPTLDRALVSPIEAVNLEILRGIGQKLSTVTCAYTCPSTQSSRHALVALGKGYLAFLATSQVSRFRVQ